MKRQKSFTQKDTEIKMTTLPAPVIPNVPTSKILPLLPQTVPPLPSSYLADRVRQDSEVSIFRA